VPPGNPHPCAAKNDPSTEGASLSLLKLAASRNFAFISLAIVPDSAHTKRMIETADELREFALESMDWVTTATSERERERFLIMARAWLEASLAVEREQANRTEVESRPRIQASARCDFRHRLNMGLDMALTYHQNRDSTPARGAADHLVMNGGLNVGHIYQSAPSSGAAAQWLWSINGVKLAGPQVMCVAGMTASLDQAKAAMNENWEKWLAWAAQREITFPNPLPLGEQPAIAVPASSDNCQQAKGACIIRWAHQLGVSYEFANGGRRDHLLGPDDRLVLDRLNRAGKLEYSDADVRSRYSATLR
jgi:hypothetical protein